jgi:hypothetical protein
VYDTCAPWKRSAAPSRDAGGRGAFRAGDRAAERVVRVSRGRAGPARPVLTIAKGRSVALAGLVGRRQ